MRHAVCGMRYVSTPSRANVSLPSLGYFEFLRVVEIGVKGQQSRDTALMNKKVRCVEDLIAWQKAMDLAEDAYRMLDAPPLSRDFAFTDQFRRAALSVPSNIAEGFERGSRAEFFRFLSIAKGSCAELRTQIQLARRIGYIDRATEAPILDEATRVGQIIGKLRSTVGQQRDSPRMPHTAYRIPNAGE